RDPVGQADDGDGIAGDVARVEDVEVARVPRLVVDEADDPAVVLRGGRVPRDEERLAGAAAGGEAPGLHGAALVVVGADGVEHGEPALLRALLADREVTESVGTALAPRVDPGELRDRVVERGRADGALAPVDAPAVEARRVLVAPLGVAGGLGAHEVEPA